jgi:membrane protein implicated in regulation of membrane protease activity
MHQGTWSLWLILGALLGPVEGITRRLWFGPAALAAGVTAAVAAAGGRGWLQFAVFTAGVLIGLCARKALLKPYQKTVIDERRKPFGATATVVDEVSDHTGRVCFGGRDWAARSPGGPIPPGLQVNIVGMVEGNTVLVCPVADQLRPPLPHQE